MLLFASERDHFSHSARYFFGRDFPPSSPPKIKSCICLDFGSREKDCCYLWLDHIHRLRPIEWPLIDFVLCTMPYNYLAKIDNLNLRSHHLLLDILDWVEYHLNAIYVYRVCSNRYCFHYVKVKFFEIISVK